MMFSSVYVPGYLSKPKNIIMYNDKPILCVNSKAHASECLQFLDGYISEKDIVHTYDKKAIGILKKVKYECQQTHNT